MTQRPSRRPSVQPRASSRGLSLILLGLALLAAAYFLLNWPVSDAPLAEPTATAALSLPATEPSPGANAFQAGEHAPETATPDDGLPVIAFSALPRQAQDTIRLIDRGGPFPYRQDGAMFQNREGLLPGRPNGYYHEYTVVTPGEADRGARRIVAGAEGELYYTADHYDSFKRVVR